MKIVLAGSAAPSNGGLAMPFRRLLVERDHEVSFITINQACCAQWIARQVILRALLRLICYRWLQRFLSSNIMPSLTGIDQKMEHHYA